MSAVLEPRMVKRNDVTTKIDAAVLEECRIAAAFRSMTLSEYISESMRSAAARDIEEGIRRRESAAKPEPKPRPKPKG